MTDDKIPFLNHLAELRERIIISVVVLAIFFGILFYYSEFLYDFITLPMKSKIIFQNSFPFLKLSPMKMKATSLIVTAPAEVFWTHTKISIVGAFVLSLPVLFYQAWKFIAPGLFPDEKRYVGPFIVVFSLFFIIGAAFCFFVVLPFALGFLLDYKMDKTQDLQTLISIGEYINFSLKFILAFGLVFELPIVILLLTKMGIVTPRMLSKNRKYAVLISFILSAILTPTPDVFNQLLMAIPVMILYEIGILASRLVTNPKGTENTVKGSDLVITLICIPLLRHILLGFKRALSQERLSLHGR